MAIIKLPNAGDQHTMTVTVCEIARGNFGEQVMFQDGTDTVYLPKDSADRQLARIFGDGFSYTDAAGNTLVFSRTPNNKKPGASPYWNITPATGAQKAATQTSSVVPSVAPAVAPLTTASVEPRRDAVLGQYLMLWDAVAHHLAQTSKKYGHGLDAAAIQAAAATVWISWKDKGIQPDGLPVSKAVAGAEPEIRMPAPSGKRLTPPAANEPPDYSNFPPPTDDDLPF
jgi:hypothetical protein